MSNDQSLQAQLKDAIARGDKDAVKALMQKGGIGGLLQTLRAVQAVASDQTVMASATSALQKSGAQVPAEVSEALQQGHLLEAVKRLRAANPGMSLKVAKDHVDAWAAKVPAMHVRQVEQGTHAAANPFARARERTPTVVMGDKPGSLRWLFVLIAFVGLAAWWWTTL